MKIYVFRNSTVENLFNGIDSEFSGYGEFSDYPNDSDYYVFFYTYVSKLNASVDIDEIENHFIKLLQMLHRNRPVIYFFLS